MKKVVYSVSRYRKDEIVKLTGLGYITDKDLIIACMSQKGKPYIRIFEDCIKDCHPIPYKPGEHTGGYYEIREVEVETKNGAKETIEVQIDYKIWYKFVD